MKKHLHVLHVRDSNVCRWQVVLTTSLFTTMVVFVFLTLVHATVLCYMNGCIFQEITFICLFVTLVAS